MTTIVLPKAMPVLPKLVPAVLMINFCILTRTPPILIIVTVIPIFEPVSGTNIGMKNRITNREPVDLKQNNISTKRLAHKAQKNHQRTQPKRLPRGSAGFQPAVFGRMPNTQLRPSEKAYTSLRQEVGFGH